MSWADEQNKKTPKFSNAVVASSSTYTPLPHYKNTYLTTAFIKRRNWLELFIRSFILFKCLINHLYAFDLIETYCYLPIAWGILLKNIGGRGKKGGGFATVSSAYRVRHNYTHLKKNNLHDWLHPFSITPALRFPLNLLQMILKCHEKW